MLHSRRESLHRNGITDLDLLQQTSATKSALSGPSGMSAQCPLSGVKQTSRRKAATSVFDPKRTSASETATAAAFMLGGFRHKVTV